MADHRQVVGLGVEQVLLGDHHVRAGQVEAALDLVHVGAAVDPRFAPQPDLVGDALVQGQVLPGELEDSLVLEHLQVDLAGLEGGVVRRALHLPGPGLDPRLLAVDLVHGREPGEQVLAQAEPHLPGFEVFVKGLGHVVLAGAGLHVGGGEEAGTGLLHLLVAGQPVVGHGAHVRVGFDGPFDRLLQGFGGHGRAQGKAAQQTERGEKVKTLDRHGCSSSDCENDGSGVSSNFRGLKRRGWLRGGPGSLSSFADAGRQAD